MHNGLRMKRLRAKGQPSIREAPKIRIPEALLAELDEVAERSYAGANLSRTQMVSLALREWLDTHKAKKEATKAK